LFLVVVLPVAGESPSRRYNGFLQLSGRAVNFAFERDVDDYRQVSETILGSFTTGLVHTRGRVTTTLVPSADQALFEVRLAGSTVLDHGVAQRRGVSVFTSAHTSLHARKLVAIQESGLNFWPATASCESTIWINDVEARSRLVESLARRHVRRTHQEFEYAAAQRTGARVSHYLDLECHAQLSEVNHAFREKIWKPLVREKLWPVEMSFKTTASHLQLFALGATPSQAGATSDVPAVSTEYDVAVCLHESLLENTGESTLRQTVIKDRHWLELMKALTGQAPRALWVHDRSVPWQVTFAADRPLDLTFGEDGFILTLRFEQIVHGDAQLTRPVVLTTSHQLDESPDGVILLRRGDVDVRFDDSLPATTEETELVAFLKRKLESVFQAEIYFDGLVPPAGASWDKLRRLQLQESSAKDGWLVFGYQLTLR
jgi:hypothetical protein